MPLAVYLDNSATTCVHPDVVEAMLPYFSQKWGNPSSLHRLGRQSRAAIETAREQVAQLLGCLPEEVYFAPGGTYANNASIVGRALHLERQAHATSPSTPGHLITTCIEHPSGLGPARYLASRGWDVTFLPVDGEGLVCPQALEQAIRPETRIVTIMWANNEVGAVQPIDKLAELCRKRNIFFHSDAVQVPGKLPIDVRKIPVNTLSISGHKFYGPKGIGVLYVRKGAELEPIFRGGGQEHGIFSGTEALANIVGIGKAAEIAFSQLEESQNQLRHLGKLVSDRVLAVDQVKLTGPAKLENRVPGHVSIVVPDVEGESVVLQCDMKGVCISSASACHSGITEPSHVVRALGLPDNEALGSLRITAGRFNTEEECIKAAETIVGVINSVRQRRKKAFAPAS